MQMPKTPRRVVKLIDRLRRKPRPLENGFPGCPNLKGSVFVVTYGRSGSTLLQSLLQNIPDAHFSGENFAVLERLFRAAHRAQRTRETWGRKDHPANHPWYGASRIDPVRFEKRLVDVFVEEIIQPPVNARWIGFKEIRYPELGDALPEYLDFVRRTFPNAHFVFNSRAAKKVAKSKWWANKPEAEVTELVESMDARFAAYAKAHPDHAKHVFYEDTVADPGSLAPVFDMLGETLDLDLARATLSVRLNH